MSRACGMRMGGLVLAIGALYSGIVLVLSPYRGFWSGDAGVKLWQMVRAWPGCLLVLLDVRVLLGRWGRASALAGLCIRGGDGCPARSPFRRPHCWRASAPAGISWRTQWSQGPPYRL